MHVFRAVLPAIAVLGLALPVTAAPIPLGGTTTVALNPETVETLTVGLGLSVAPIAPGTLEGLTATFPITGADVENGDYTRFYHSGGLQLSAGGTSVDLSNFVIDLPLLTLLGQVAVNGMGDDELPLFDIDAATLGLSLTDAAAGTLNSVFGIDALQGGIPIGIATVNPAAVPEPSVLLLIGSAVGALAMRRRRR
jgi:hypothetical protein